MKYNYTTITLEPNRFSVPLVFTTMLILIWAVASNFNTSKSVENTFLSSSINPLGEPENIALCGAISESQATVEPVKSGLWSSNSTWPNGNKPTSSDDVVIPKGITLTMVGTCRAKTITVKGTLNALNGQSRNADIDLRTQGIMVENDGLMEIGTASEPYYATDRCVITLTGAARTNAGSDYKGIMVMGGGKLELHGKERKSWTNIATTANAGAKQITLKDAVEWEVGDKIALTSTGLASGGSKAWGHVDEAEIVNISANKKTLTLKTGLKYKHIGGTKTYTRAKDGKKWNVDIFGEVGLLSHYIKIQSDISEDNSQGFGGHIMLMKNSTTHVEHVELYKMGQKGVLGRYPFHWHLNEDKAKGSYFKNSSVHKSFNRAVTIHGTDYVTVDGIFAYDHIGHGLFLEDGGERFNTIKNNVIFMTRQPAKGQELTPSDNQFAQLQNRTPASYWITNPNNIFENNVAAGTEGTGFWFAFPENGPILASKNIPYYKGLNVIKQPLGKFDGFVAHSCRNGWDIFDQITNSHSIKRNSGWDINTDQFIENGLFYGNEQALYSGLGIGGDATKVVYRNCVFSDNKTITMLASDIRLENCLFNVDSDLGVFNGTREFYKFYDGPGIHINCHFEGWDRNNAQFMQQKEGAGATENLNPTFRGTTKGFSGPFPFEYVQLRPNARHRKAALGFKDYDGGLLGKAHTTLLRDIPFYRVGKEYKHSSWKNVIRSDYYIGNLWLTGMNNDPAIAIQRTKPGTDNECLYDEGANTGTYKAGLFVNEGFTYDYYFSKLPTNRRVTLGWYRGDQGDETMVNFKGFGNLGGFQVSGGGVRRLNSRAAVEASNGTAYFINGNGDVYVKLVSRGPNNRVNVFFRWTGNGSYRTIALPCTRNDVTPSQPTDDNNNNQAPVVNITAPSNNATVEVGQEITLSAGASDPDGNLDKVNFFVNDEIVFSDASRPFETTFTPTAIGTYTIIARAIDKENAKTDASVTITVVEKNVAPTASFTTPTNNILEDGYSELIVTVDATDPNGDNLTVVLKINGEEVRTESVAPYEWGHSGSPNPSETVGLAVGDHVFEATVTDEKGLSTTISKTITVTEKNVAPTASFTTPTESVLNEGYLELVVTVDATDPNGDEMTVVLKIDGQEIRSESMPPFEWGHAGSPNPSETVGLAVGDHIIEAIVTDAKGLSTTISKTITVDRVTSTSSSLDRNELTVFPNPSNSGVFKISEDSEWQVYNLSGINLMSGKSDRVDLSSEPRGVYFLKINGKVMQLLHH